MALSSTFSASSKKASPPHPKTKRANTAKRKRGGQPGNFNARKAGTFSVYNPDPLSALRLRVTILRQALASGACPPDDVLEQARATLDKLLSMEQDLNLDQLAVVPLELKLFGLISTASVCHIPITLYRHALENIATDPFTYFEESYRDWGITRDVDSFFPVSKLSA